MSVYRIRSFDLKRVPRDTVFVIDTNVLYFVHSGYLQTHTKGTDYSNIIQQIMADGYVIAVSALSLQELLHLIEKKEYELYCKNNGLDTSSYRIKDFRALSAERPKVQQKMQTVVNEMAQYALNDGNVTISMISSFVNALSTNRFEPMDYLLVSNYDEKKTIFITDDRDFRLAGTSLRCLTI